MTEPAVFDALLDYVDFGPEDAETLRRLGPQLQPAFEGIIDDFYAAIARHPKAAAVFTGGAPQIARQKNRLREWLEELFGGTYDHAYFRHRAKIGRMHVKIALPQHFMFSAMTIVREGLHEALTERVADRALRSRGHVALDRICDIELAIMLETYRERFVHQQRAKTRLATLGQLAASVGHELRNPLAVMSTSMHLLRRRVADPGALRHVDKVDRQIALANRIVTDLLSIVRDRAPQREKVHLGVLVEEVVEGVPNPQQIDLRVEVPADLPALAVDRLQVRQALANLLSNAYQALEGRDGGSVALLARDEEGTLRVEVTDDGPGLDPEVIHRVFEPLTTTRDTGVGLGLALVDKIVEAHGGQVFAENREEGGARVGFTIPRAFLGDDT